MSLTNTLARYSRRVRCQGTVYDPQEDKQIQFPKAAYQGVAGTIHSVLH